MAYRNGTYVAFHAEGTSDPTETDFKYYNLLKAWTEKKDDDFSMVDSHEKTSSVRDSSKKKTLQDRLEERLRLSKHLLLLIGPTTKLDNDWVPHEIAYAIDNCQLPVIATYTKYKKITIPGQLSDLWPQALTKRIQNGSAKVIHIPFKKEPVRDAIEQFHLGNLPNTALDYYSSETYKKWGIE